MTEQLNVQQMAQRLMTADNIFDSVSQKTRMAIPLAAAARCIVH